MFLYAIFKVFYTLLFLKYLSRKTYADRKYYIVNPLLHSVAYKRRSDKILISI